MYVERLRLGNQIGQYETSARPLECGEPFTDDLPADGERCAGAVAQLA
jgi:hypothetical protein